MFNKDLLLIVPHFSLVTEFLEAEAALFPSPPNSSISELPIFFHCSMHVNPSADPILCWLLKFTVSLKSRWFDSSDFIPFQIILLVDGLFFERLSSPPPRHGFSFLHTSVHLSHSGEFGSLCVFFLKKLVHFIHVPGFMYIELLVGFHISCFIAEVSVVLASHSYLTSVICVF